MKANFSPVCPPARNATVKLGALEEELKTLREKSKDDPAAAALAKDLEDSAEYQALKSFDAKWEAFKKARASCEVC